MDSYGIINLLKPAGMTSHDCVYQLRRITGIKRIGHTGTLDPMAAGVLPLCIGGATRIMDYLDMDKKTYRCEMVFGLTTDTWDIWGGVLEDKRCLGRNPDIDAIRKVFKQFEGRIYQTPPAYSSVRIAGKRLYEYAREGKKIEAEKRPVVVYGLKIIRYDETRGRLSFDLECSKGTYVRSICHEAGKALGRGGAMSFLLRAGSGDFKLEETVSFEHLSSDWKRYLFPVDFPLSRLGKINISEDKAAWFCNGGYIDFDEAEVLRRPQIDEAMEHIRFREGLERAYSVYSGESFLGVALFYRDENKFKADKVFNR